MSLVLTPLRIRWMIPLIFESSTTNSAKLTVLADTSTIIVHVHINVDVDTVLDVGIDVALDIDLDVHVQLHVYVDVHKHESEFWARVCVYFLS